MRNKTQYPIPKTPKNLIRRRLLAALALIIGTGLLLIFTNGVWGIGEAGSVGGVGGVGGWGERRITLSSTPLFSSSIAKPHPLPPTLAQWQDKTNSGDYFSQVTTTQVGYLVWSQFPIKIYVEKPKAVSEQQAQTWVNSVLQAVQEWNTYLPLTVVQQPEVADIKIMRKAPPLQISPGSSIPRARSAQTTYELYANNKVLSHRFTILLSPSQTGEYIQAAARHELGHALGIWGHSPLQTDALYFSQVRKPSPISVRDVNTLKRVYEQPTALGWP
ncbi:MAG: peptidase [Nostoc sp. ChiSLP02]|nr:peptidase [Nostoc sp. DedSLP05]MDZ8101273.1 peptidase [Nostoc sp. DedSLP01]MDZ8185149.1 peptidase [Nostoc sp. ChiSLP02]